MKEAKTMADPNTNKGDINLIQYGALCHQVEELDRKICHMEKQLERLVMLANKSQGALWIGMTNGTPYLRC